MTFLETLGLDAAKEIAKRLVSQAFERERSRPDTASDFETNIAAHLVFVDNITSRVEFYGLGEAKSTDRDTVDLFASLPRKFAGKSASNTVTELHLISAADPYVLLGAPGAGKTTSLKRIARRLLTAVPHGATDDAQYPIFVRLREMTRERSIVELLGSILGLTAHATHWTQKEKESAIAFHERKIGAIASIAYQTGALILLDGLDEVDTAVRASVERDISALAEHSRGAHIIVACRSGDYTAQLEQFNVLELAPLGKQQIARIARRWTKDWKGFLKSLAAQPFEDLASRPLFLCQLLVIFDQTGSIPDQPSDAVERVVRLALEEWDQQHKKQLRRSKYAKFDSAKKRDFLAALAFWFFYKVPRERFTTGLLELVYLELHARFELPDDDARLVAEELETHTGIFVEVGHQFEFSHLSLQEFLAAAYLARQPIVPEYITYLKVRPAVLAIAVALSTRPEAWLAELVLRDASLASLDDVTLRSFFARLLQERPCFESSAQLGIVAISLIGLLKYTDEYVRLFLDLPAVRGSINTAAGCYRISSARGQYRLTLRDEVLPLNIDPRILMIGASEMAEIERENLLRRSAIWA
jgi:hypothetical protein